MKKSLFSIVVLIVSLVVVFGCVAQQSSDNGAKNAALNTAPVSKETVPTYKSPTEADFIRAGAEQEVTMRELEKKLTPVQLRRNWEIRKAALDIAIADHQGANKNLPAWVAEHYRAFEGEEYTKGHFAFQRSLGWGAGQYKGKVFEWFAYTNTDAYVQFDLSVPLAQEDIDKILGAAIEDGVKVSKNENLDVKIPDSNRYNPGTGTWIGVSAIDWTESHCVKPRFAPCDIGGTLEMAADYLNSELGLKFQVRGRFPWEPLLPSPPTTGEAKQ